MDPKLTEVSQLFDRFKAAMMWNDFNTCTKLLSQLKGVVLFICISIFTRSVLALGTIVSAKPLEELGYKGWNGDQNSVTSPYASSVYLGWAMAYLVALIVTGVLPIVSWFATYRFSISSAICVGIFINVIKGEGWRAVDFGEIGSITAVMGPSGAGKSTLLDGLAGRIASGSLKGRVSLDGMDVSPSLIKRTSAYIMQDDCLFSMLIVYETLMFDADFWLGSIPRIEKL